MFLSDVALAEIFLFLIYVYISTPCCCLTLMRGRVFLKMSRSSFSFEKKIYRPLQSGDYDFFLATLDDPRDVLL